MNELIEQLKKISETRESAMQCGGSYSANSLRKCLSLLNEIDQYKGQPKYDEVKNALLIVREIWQSSLIKHNSNKLKFIAYDVETGLQVGRGENA